MKTFLAVSSVYLLCGVGVAAYSVHLSATGKAHFLGTAGALPSVALLQTVFVWPYALAVNMKGN